MTKKDIQFIFKQLKVNLPSSGESDPLILLPLAYITISKYTTIRINPNDTEFIFDMSNEILKVKYFKQRGENKIYMTYPNSEEVCVDCFEFSNIDSISTNYAYAGG